MENTRVIAPNGTSYQMEKRKIFQNKSNFIHPVPMYPMNSRGGAQILMNTQSVFTATNMHFSPTMIQTKSSNDIDLTNTISTKNVPKQQVTATFSGLEQTFFAKTNTKSTTISPDKMLFLYTTSFNSHDCATNVDSQANHRNNMSLSCDNKFSNDNSSHAHETSTGGKTFVNSLKSFVHSLIKPIMDVVGSTDIAGTSKSVSAAATASTLSTQTNHKSGPPPPTYCDKRICMDSLCLSIDKPATKTCMVSNRELYFDCDDYIDGGEDTIDFVAASTKIVSHPLNGTDEFRMDFNTNKHPTINKDSIYYDCMNKTDIFETPTPTLPVSLSISESCDQCETSDRIEKHMEATNVKKLTFDEMSICNMKQPWNSVQYCDGNKKLTMTNIPKSNRNAQHRRHRANRKNSSKYWKKSSASNKNRHEKQRHEIEKDLHEDLESCYIETIVASAYEEDFDLEIIDLDGKNTSKKCPNVVTTESVVTISTTATTTEATITVNTVPISNAHQLCIETPIPSPEKISGCIFTRFFPFKNSSNCSSKLSPLHFLKKLPVPQLNTTTRCTTHAPVDIRHVSESESDDSFIMFEEDISLRSPSSRNTLSQRSRQLSECSDDFILFEDGTEDVCLRYDTTDEDCYLTDSTDDETNSSSDDESNNESTMEHLSSSHHKKVADNHQPDSGFEEKKVRFNLSPVVHEIRAWKFAYSQARKGQWEQMGRDRGRFEKRINEVSRILSPILATDHRAQIYKERFQTEGTQIEHISSSSP